MLIFLIILCIVCLVIGAISLLEDEILFSKILFALAVVAGLAIPFAMNADDNPKVETLEEKVTRLERELEFVKMKPKYLSLCEEYGFYVDKKYDCENYVVNVNKGMSLMDLENNVKIMRKVKRLPISQDSLATEKAIAVAELEQAKLNLTVEKIKAQVEIDKRNKL